MKKKHYYLDINLTSMKILDWGETELATLTGNTDNLNVHRVFLSKGQFNKLKNKISNSI